MTPDRMRRLQQMQASLAKAQKAIEESTVEASAGGGAVNVGGNGQPKGPTLKIAPEAGDPADVEMLEDLIVAAVNEALEKVRALQAQHLGGLTHGLTLPA